MSENKDEEKRLRWLVLLTVIIGTFLGRLDQTIVNLALPKIIDDYGITVSSAGWIATAYILANAVFVPIWGKLGDMIGRKKVYMMGFSIFILGSVLAGMAWNLTSMIVFRVIQAIAGSADYPTAMSILTNTFKDDKERAQALGIWSASFAAAAVFGPLVGGPLIDHFGWRSVFLINLPVGIIGMLMAIKYVKESVSKRSTKDFDLLGGVTLGVSLSALVLVLDKGMDWGWLSSASLISYAVSILFAYLFVRVEQKAAEPIVDLKFFSNQMFVSTLLNNFIVFMGMMGSIFLIPVFAQTFLGYTATQTGYLFIPMAVFMMLGAPIGGKLTGKVSSRIVIFWSTIVAGCGMLLFSLLDPRSTAIDIIVPLCVMAFGMGFGMAQRTNIIASVVPKHEIGAASSVLALARNIAGAFGIAFFGTILNNSIKANVIELSQYSSLHSTNPADYGTFLSLITLKAEVMAYDHVFVVAAIVLLLGSFTALLLKIDKENLDMKVQIEA
jgi:EmrB/QacA subfamily drug resistance transporter